MTKKSLKYLLGTKIGMVRLFDVKGKAIACTVVHAEPNVVLEKKPGNSIKIGYDSAKENKVNKAHKGIFKKVGADLKKHIATFANVQGDYNVGDKIKVDSFKVGEYVDVQGTTKGRGMTGAIFRWNFKIGPLSHGHGYPHRWQGSLAFGRGGSAPQRVYKGKKMSGRYGHEIQTIQNLTVVKIVPEDNTIVISGAIPGPEGSLVVIHTAQKKTDKDSVKYDLITKEIQAKIEIENAILEEKQLTLEKNKEAEAEAKETADEQQNVEVVQATNEENNSVVEAEETKEVEEKQEQPVVVDDENTNK